MPQPIFNPTYLNLEYLFYKVYQFVEAIYTFLTTTDFFAKFYSFLKVFLSLAAIFLIAVFIYSVIRIYEIKEEEKRQLKTFIIRGPDVSLKNEKWEKIKKDIQSANSSDWRLAIIEADSLLDEMLLGLEYKGADLGERLKSADPADFRTLDDAWEAHKVRNRIAHDGSAFALDQKEAHRIIGLYEKVFREFKFI